MDDGSTDNCSSICDEYSNLDDRVKVIHKKTGDYHRQEMSGFTKQKGNTLCLWIAMMLFLKQ